MRLINSGIIDLRSCDLKKSGLFSIIVLICVNGCEKDKSVEKGHLEPIPLQSVASLSEDSFFVSEQDSFHPQSVLESVRKKNLVSTGKNPNPSSIKVEDDNQAWYILNPKDKNFHKMDLIGFRSRPVLLPAFPFDYENDINALRRLYRSHKLDAVLNDDMEEIEKLKALMEYTYDFMEGGRPPKPGEVPGPSAEVITSLRRENDIGGTSREYAALFCQLALSCGFNARLIGMHTIDSNGELLTHDVCEVYLNREDKWAVFDVYSKATFYLREGTILSALEIHDIILDKNYRSINPVTLRGDFRDIISLREEVLRKYHYIYVWRMNNILGASPRGGTIPWEDLYRYHLVWEDAYSLVSDGFFDRLAQFNSANVDEPLDGVHYVTRNKQDFDWSLGHVELAIERNANDFFIVYMDTLTPNFSKIQVSDNVSFEYIDKYTLKINYMLGNISFNAVNAFGVSGPVSYIRFPG